MKKTVLREYARLIARCGVNVQKGVTRTASRTALHDPNTSGRTALGRAT